jgi:hypothetical protein
MEQRGKHGERRKQADNGTPAPAGPVEANRSACAVHYLHFTALPPS